MPARRSWIAIGAVASIVLAAPAARALTTVTTNLDSGPGSLRQAIADAPAGDTIDFANSVTGTITLTSGALVVTKDLTISGPGSSVLAVSGNDATTVLSIPKNNGPALNVTVSGLTIRNGSATLVGGGIFGADNVISVSGCAFSDNFATDGGAIFSGKFGTLNVSSSTFVGNSAAGFGGALLAETGTLTDSTFIDNTATGGGAVVGDPTLSMTVSRCTFSGNVAFEDGGAILSDEPGTLMIADSTFDANQAGRTGGAVYRDADFNVSNSTFSGNRATGGLNKDGSALFIEGNLQGVIANCTFTGNRVTGAAVPGAAIDLTGGLIAMRNTIVANNTPTNCAVLTPATLTSGGHNLDSGTSCGLAATGDLSSTVPLLGPLASNGGATRTHALLAGSPAVNAGDPAAPGSGGTACEAADQRGVTRPRLTACDIGAYERACGDGVVDTAIGEQCDDGNAVDGDGCDSNCTFTGCGNGIVTSGEQCDDGNTVSGDCCSATCQFESSGASCPIAGSPCTAVDTCDGAGHCVRGPQATCVPGKPIIGGKASLQLKAFVKTTKNQFRWKWLKGALTMKNAFGNPVTGTTDYLLCVYDGTGLITTARAPAGGLCNVDNPVSCWKVTGTGFKYNDKDRTPDGVQKLKLKAGLAGKAKITLKAKGKLFHMPFPGGLVSPVTVQVRNSGNACWQTVHSFPPALKNTGAQFKDKSDLP